jgi:Cu(I)/Ag(I) efflux system membrane protein CusA/SilA
MARYGVNIRDVQDVIEVAMGGIRATTTVEGRERYPIRVRYQREIRDNVESMERILVPGAGEQQVPLSQLATIEYVRGPQEIKSEDNFLVSYVLFDKKADFAEVEVVEQASEILKAKIDSGEVVLPAGVHYKFSGSYENQLRFQKQLLIMLPLSLFIIFIILYFQFRSVPITLLVFLGIAVVWSGGFIGIWATAQPWFLDFEVFGRNIRDVFNMRNYNLSTAVWIGFIALFGIATDDGVLITTYLNQTFGPRRPGYSVECDRSGQPPGPTRPHDHHHYGAGPHACADQYRPWRRRDDPHGSAGFLGHDTGTGDALYGSGELLPSQGVPLAHRRPQGSFP